MRAHFGRSHMKPSRFLLYRTTVLLDYPPTIVTIRVCMCLLISSLKLIYCNTVYIIILKYTYVVASSSSINLPGKKVLGFPI